LTSSFKGKRSLLSTLPETEKRNGPTEVFDFDFHLNNGRIVIYFVVEITGRFIILRERTRKYLYPMNNFKDPLVKAYLGRM